MQLPMRQLQSRGTMTNPTIEQILAPKPEARPRIYAYSIKDDAHAGLFTRGRTTGGMTRRLGEPYESGEGE